MSKRGKNQDKPVVPRYYELERFRKSTNRKIWLCVTFLSVVTVMSLGLALIALARPIPVVMLDSQGKPVLFEDTATPRRKMSDVRVRYFAKHFINSFVGVDSAAVAENLEQSLNIMTPRYRKVVASDSEELARRKQYEGQNLRSRISQWKVRIGHYDPDDLGARIHLIVTGKMAFEPRVGEMEGEGEVAKWFLTQLVLQRVPVTELSIHGLQTDFCHTRFFHAREDLESYMLEKARRP